MASGYGRALRQARFYRPLRVFAAVCCAVLLVMSGLNLLAVAAVAGLFLIAAAAVFLVALAGVELGFRETANQTATLRRAVLSAQAKALSQQRGAGAAVERDYERDALLLQRITAIEEALGIAPPSSIASSAGIGRQQ